HLVERVRGTILTRPLSARLDKGEHSAYFHLPVAPRRGIALVEKVGDRPNSGIKTPRKSMKKAICGAFSSSYWSQKPPQNQCLDLSRTARDSRRVVHSPKSGWLSFLREDDVVRVI
ncbi:MAG: hypothetical protein ACR2M3_03430, partial [Thermomicrobiales bacterium]